MYAIGLMQEKFSYSLMSGIAASTGLRYFIVLYYQVKNRIFTKRLVCIVQTVMARCLRLSVHLPHAGIVSKRFYHWIVPPF